MKYLNSFKKLVDLIRVSAGMYKVKVLYLYLALSFKKKLGLIPSLKTEQYISIKTGGIFLPFFIKDQLDFDVLWDSMCEDQYRLSELEKNEVRDEIKIIFDLGTNIGTAALKFYQKFPKATIYCFEPDPYNFKRLEKNVSLIEQPERIKLYNYAVSGLDDEKVSFFRGKSSHWSSSLTRRNNTEEEVVVDTVTLDTFCKENNIEKIDILKMDIEGAETDALEGFRSGLDSVDYFLGEIHPGVMKDSVMEFILRCKSFDIEYFSTETDVFKFKRKKLK